MKAKREKIHIDLERSVWEKLTQLKKEKGLISISRVIEHLLKQHGDKL